MKVKVSEANKAQLNWMVAKAADKEWFLTSPSLILCVWKHCPLTGERDTSVAWRPSTDWSQGGPIIEQDEIVVRKGNPLIFPKGNENGEYSEPLWIAGKMHGRTMLEAAMRCFAVSRLGDTVEVPDQLV